MTDGVPVTWALHVCYGNRYARPSWEGHYDFLFPAVLKAARVDQLVLEFARKGLEDLRLIKQYGWDSARPRRDRRQVTEQWRPPELVAARIRRALDYVTAGRLMINPDCGLRHLAPEVASAEAARYGGWRGACPGRADQTRTQPFTRHGRARSTP